MDTGLVIIKVFEIKSRAESIEHLWRHAGNITYSLYSFPGDMTERPSEYVSQHDTVLAVFVSSFFLPHKRRSSMRKVI